MEKQKTFCSRRIVRSLRSSMKSRHQRRPVRALGLVQCLAGPKRIVYLRQANSGSHDFGGHKGATVGGDSTNRMCP